MQAEAGEDQVESPRAERQRLLVGDEPLTRRPPDHVRRQIRLDQPADLRAAAQGRGELPGMAAELEGKRKCAADVAEPLDQPPRRLADQEIEAVQGGRGAAAPPSQEPPVEHRRLHVPLYRFGHALYMVRRSADRQPAAVKKSPVLLMLSALARAAGDCSCPRPSGH